MNGAALLTARGLRLALPDRARRPLFGRPPLIEVLKGVDLELRRGETLALVGESGSGKTSLGRTLLRLLEPTGGRLTFQGRDITHLPVDDPRLRELRADMQIIFQDPQSALNPRHRIGTILSQPLAAFGRGGRGRNGAAAAALLERVGLPAAFAGRFPHQLSGGQRQRVGIARAIALRPKLIVADEIVSGLDVATQAQILDLLGELTRETDTALVFISHDLSVVRLLCDRVLVLRDGEVVETAATATLFARPQHRYTRELLAAIPLPEVDPGWLDAAVDDLVRNWETHWAASAATREETSSMPIQTAERTALVTGAGRGIGREFVSELLARGARKVYAGARDPQHLAELAALDPSRVEAVRLDVTDFEQIAAAAGRCGDVDLLINNAGVNRNTGLIAADDLSAARAEMSVNYFASLAMCRTFAPVLRRNGGGAIVNVLSVLARANLPLMGSLCASKAAAYSMTQGVRAELAGQGTRVIAVLPGAVDTDMSRDLPPPKMPPAEVAAAALDALEDGGDEIYPGEMAARLAARLRDDAPAAVRELGRLLPPGTPSGKSDRAAALPPPEPVYEGGCACGAVRYRVRGAALKHTRCRCENCRRISGAEAVCWYTFERSRLTFEAGEPVSFSTSQKGRRGFCPQCGATLTYELEVFPEQIDLTASSFAQPDGVAVNAAGTRRPGLRPASLAGRSVTDAP